MERSLVVYELDKTEQASELIEKSIPHNPHAAIPFFQALGVCKRNSRIIRKVLNGKNITVKEFLKLSEKNRNLILNLIEKGKKQ